MESRFVVRQLDHVHVFVKDRTAAVNWYAHVLGLQKTHDYTEHGDPHGPVVMTTADGITHIALFEGTYDASSVDSKTIAFSAAADGFLEFARRTGRQPVDHGNSYSVYLRDPDGNPLEITTYEVDAVKRSLPPQ